MKSTLKTIGLGLLAVAIVFVGYVAWVYLRPIPKQETPTINIQEIKYPQPPVYEPKSLKTPCDTLHGGCEGKG